MHIILVALLAAVVAGTAACGHKASSEPAAPEAVGPRYAEDGALMRPKDFRSWVFVGASTGLSYSEETGREGPGMFHNVYLHPQAYAHYARTGMFPEKTMLALTIYKPAQKVAPNRQGFFEGDFVALEIALKDHERFEEGWAYFSFSGREDLLDKAKAFPKSACYSCHVKHGADDNVFVQFYPVLRRLKEVDPGGRSQ